MLKIRETTYAILNDEPAIKVLKRVDSCPCYFPYIESVPSPEFGTTTDIRQTAGHEYVIATVLLSSAN